MWSLTEDEKQRLRSAMQGLINDKTDGMEHFGSIHGGPNGTGPIAPYCPKAELDGMADNICCIHIMPGFLPWHRLYMKQMEDALGMALPYWDWTVNGTLPDLWEGLNPTFRDGVWSKCGEPWNEVKRTNESLPIKQDKEKIIELSFDQKCFKGFEPMIKVPHDTVHRDIGCEMQGEPQAGFDPIFFLHHTFVDYQWAFWQELQRIREGSHLKSIKCGNFCQTGGRGTEIPS